MPQVRCPHCGTTMNLENRRETDFSLILGALHSRERSFSELLRITGLPRKTLYLRLKELCKIDAIIKNKLYYLNEANPHKEWEKKLMNGNSRLFNKKTIALLLLLCIGLPVTTNVLATFFQSPPPPPEPGPIGYFTAIVTANNVSNVYGWQVGLCFNSTNLEVIDVRPGGFLTAIEQNAEAAQNETTGYEITKKTMFCYTIIDRDILFIGQTLLGEDVSETNHSGSLVIIKFGYYYAYQEPELIFDESTGYNTMLLRADCSEIQLHENTVTIRCLP